MGICETFVLNLVFQDTAQQIQRKKKKICLYFWLKKKGNRDRINSLCCTYIQGNNRYIGLHLYSGFQRNTNLTGAFKHVNKEALRTGNGCYHSPQATEKASQVC